MPRSAADGSARIASIKALAAAQNLLAAADIHIQGSRPWDMQVHHPDTLIRALSRGSLGLGEAYMDGWW
ncbi:MAG: hypothetical protein ACK51Y_03820, partial [Burkholderiales bacterium]